MKNQPNKATVKDGLPTAEQIAQWVIDNRYPKSENNKLSDIEMYHALVVDVREYSDQQNAYLLEKIVQLEESYAKFAKERDEQYGEYIDLNISLRNENAELTKQVAAITHQRDLYRKRLNESKGIHVAKDLGIPEDIEMAPIVQSNTDELRERVKELEACLERVKSNTHDRWYVLDVCLKALSK